MKPIVVLTATYPAIVREILSGLCEFVEHPTEYARSEDDMITILSEADAAITLLSDPLSRKVLAANSDLRMIANYAVGYNNVDIEAARDLGITVTNTPGVLTEATADLTMGLMLAVMRRIVEGDREVRTTGQCIWEPLHLLGTGLTGKRLGIVGMGRIGTAVATRARSFGMDVTGVHRPAAAVAGGPLDEMLATSDVVSIHAPLTTQTRHIINRERLASMKQGAFLINTARGPLVDEVALCDALEDGHLAGAALDVYEDEPEVNPRLLSMTNVVLAPHIGSATEETRSAMAQIAATEVARFLRGQGALHSIV
jgi:glyoxylate reductase